MALTIFLVSLVLVWVSGAIILAVFVIPWLMRIRMHYQIIQHLKEEARK